jgi:hypothetical protein
MWASQKYTIFCAYIILSVLLLAACHKHTLRGKMRLRSVEEVLKSHTLQTFPHA